MTIDLIKIRAEIDAEINSGRINSTEGRWRWSAAKRAAEVEKAAEADKQRKQQEQERRFDMTMTGSVDPRMVATVIKDVQSGRVDIDRLQNMIPREVYQEVMATLMREQTRVMFDPGMMSSGSATMRFNSRMGFMPPEPKTEAQVSREALEKAKEVIEKQNEILNNLKEDALILHKVDRVSKDGKYTFIEKQGTQLRVKAPEGLKVGHEVLLHPKTMGIVEDLGFPPLEASPFSPGRIPNITWDDIAGLDQAKRDLVEAIELPHKYKEMYAHYGKRQVKGLLLSGDPGCGKTMLGKAAANSLAKIYGAESAKTGFLYIKGPEILNQYVGQTEQTIREIFIDAGRHFDVHGYPAVIFIDEADAILAARGTRTIGIGNTIVPAFLTEMDGMEDAHAIVILATNRPDVLDPAIIREGRIDRKVHVTRPDIQDATKIAKLNLAKYPVATGFDLDDLAEGLACELFRKDRFVGDDKPLKSVVSGAMIAATVDLAVANAMHRDIEGERTLEGFGGLSGDDILAAVERIHHQNQNVTHDFE